jgi:FkbM family methyltransferase
MFYLLVSVVVIIAILANVSEADGSIDVATDKGDIKTIWQSNTPFPSTNPSKRCRWVDFQGAHLMCVHQSPDVVSDRIHDKGRWPDCDVLHLLWNKRPLPSKQDIYIDIGGNIGSCVFHMLHHTKATIRVFEPNPDNLFCLTSTLLNLPSATRDRVTVHPIALGMSRSTTSLYVSKKNAGNGVVGHSIGRAKETFNDPIATHTDRYDVLVDTNTIVGLLKMDAQGFECNIMRGMGKAIDRIKVIKTEVANLWLSGHNNCSDKILFDLLQGSGKQLKDVHGTVLTKPKSGLDLYDVIATTRPSVRKLIT